MVRRIPSILGRQRWACAYPARRAGDTTNRKNASFLISLHFEFVDFPRTHKVSVFHNERLVSSAVLLVHLHNELLVIGDGELLQGEYRASALLPRHAGNVVVGSGSSTCSCMPVSLATFLSTILNVMKSMSNGTLDLLRSSVWKYSSPLCE